jgi:hypothetical protein
MELIKKEDDDVIIIEEIRNVHKKIVKVPPNNAFNSSVQSNHQM